MKAAKAGRLHDARTASLRGQSARAVVCGSGLACEGGVNAAVVGHIAAQVRRHGIRHDQHRHPHRLRHALDG
jgi:hypothetical protein